jgi:ATP-dependent exoDNAse (exonuclease V) alpha subunit
MAFAQAEREERLAVTHALDHCFAREAVVFERKLLTEALKRGLGAVTVEEVKKELARRPLIRAERDGRTMAASPDMLARESRLIAYARRGRGRFRPLGDAARPCTRDWFNDGQKAAVRHVLGSRDAVTVVRGAAGTGKTTLEQEIGAALSEAGRPVVAVAQSTDAVHVLRTEAGFDGAATVARFFKDTKMQEAARGGVVLLDEASQVGTHDMLRLFDIAQDVNARIVLVGDRRQHRSVAAGEPLKLLEEQAGLPVAEVTEILRQAGDYKKASGLLAAGETEAGFAELDRLGWIKEVPDAERYQALADAYLAATAEKKRNGEPKSALVVSPTHAEAGRITQTLRAALKEQGKLGEERILDVWLPAYLTAPQKGDPANYEAGDLLQFHQNAPGHPNGSRLIAAGGEELPLRYAERFEVYRPARLALAVGDRIRITTNGKTRDGKHALRNGAVYTVRGFTPQGDPIIDHHWVIGRDFGHLAHGYVVTSHASQGRTVDEVFVGLSSQSFPATNRRSFYVAATRGKEQAVIFTDDKKELLKSVQRTDSPLSALDLARTRQRSLRRHLGKTLAHLRRLATLARTHPPRTAGRERAPHWQREAGYAR